MTTNNFEHLRLQTVAETGHSVNGSGGGVYYNGRPLPEERYLLILEKYLDLLTKSSTRKLLVARVAKQAKFYWHTANKTINCFISGGTVFGTPSMTNRPLGPGSKLGIMHKHESFILYMRFKHPFCCNQDYVNRLLERYGLRVSCLFITRWFQ